MSSNVSAIPSAVTPSEAIALLQRMRDIPDHTFLADDVGLVVGGHLDSEQISSYRHVTDAHLLALARRHQAALATLDRGIAALGRGQDVFVIQVP